MQTVEVKLIDGYTATLSYISDLIMLHTPTTSAQWDPQLTGIEILAYERGVKVGFHTNNGSQTYQSWLFDATSKKAIVTFFRSLGYNHLDEMQ